MLFTLELRNPMTLQVKMYVIEAKCGITTAQFEDDKNERIKLVKTIERATSKELLKLWQYDFGPSVSTVPGQIKIAGKYYPFVARSSGHVQIMTL